MQETDVSTRRASFLQSISSSLSSRQRLEALKQKPAVLAPPPRVTGLEDQHVYAEANSLGALSLRLGQQGQPQPAANELRLKLLSASAGRPTMPIANVSVLAEQAEAYPTNPSAATATGSAMEGPATGQSKVNVADFILSLIKIFENESSDIIEWQDGRIYIHKPAQLEAEVLDRYFRHSNWTSFQRQLNYFGFLKVSGYGKLSSCCYANEKTTSDIKSLLALKRKSSRKVSVAAAARQDAMNHPAGAMATTADLNYLRSAMSRQQPILGAYPQVAQEAILMESMVRERQEAMRAIAIAEQRRASMEKLALLNLSLSYPPMERRFNMGLQDELVAELEYRRRQYPDPRVTSPWAA